MKKYNFNPGPSLLPGYTIENSAKAVNELYNSGLSILEISHRSKEFTGIIEEATTLIKELLNVPDGYSVLFLQGGASLQFCMIPYNLLDEGQTAAYLETGSWAKKAIKEVKFFGNVNVVASSSDSNYNYIPKQYDLPENAAYFHITTNNTIFGTQIYEDYNVNIPLVADFSSDIFSRTVDVSKYALIYAGAQKNLGPAGVTLVIVKDEILGKVKREIPTMLDYRTHIEGGSLFNTPPVFAIYASLQTLKWLKEQGGLAEMERKNIEKADLLYEEIDKNPLFKGTANKEDRSKMNVTFIMDNPDLESEFLALAAEHDIIGIKGHRSVGGFRASIYNAMPLESVEVLVDVMKVFAGKHEVSEV
ncbi:MAG: 3-phosphoserine/phosphohydroxythreonine transaminase [Cytophagales bacterium]|nr:3-phosphoserine/phosphohydroxythreonine transaminase [Cytophagales bacterium]